MRIHYTINSLWKKLYDVVRKGSVWRDSLLSTEHVTCQQFTRIFSRFTYLDTWDVFFFNFTLPLSLIVMAWDLKHVDSIFPSFSIKPFKCYENANRMSVEWNNWICDIEHCNNNEANSFHKQHLSFPPTRSRSAKWEDANKFIKLRFHSRQRAHDRLSGNLCCNRVVEFIIYPTQFSYPSKAINARSHEPNFCFARYLPAAWAHFRFQKNASSRYSAIYINKTKASTSIHSRSLQEPSRMQITMKNKPVFFFVPELLMSACS